MRAIPWKKGAVVLAVIGLIVGAVYFDLASVFSFDNLKASQADLAALYASHTVAFVAGYFAIYVAVAALSLPGAAVLTLAGGAVFGFAEGLVLVSFASTIGATGSFMVSRYLFRDWVEARFGERLATVQEGIERDGAFYLFTLRLIPAVPFFVVNLSMGLTRVKVTTFYWVSQLGMLAGTAVYVNAGTQLSHLDTPGDILSPALIGSFVLLGGFPIVAKKAMAWVRTRQAGAGTEVT